MIHLFKSPTQFTLSGEIGTIPVNQQVSGATMSTDANVLSVLHVENWPYTIAETNQLGEFFVFDKTKGQLAFVKGYRDVEIIDNKIDFFLDKPFSEAINGVDVFIIVPTSYRGQTKWSVINIGSGTVIINDNGIVNSNESHLFSAENAEIKPMVIDATNSDVYATTAEVSNIGGGSGVPSGSNYKLESEDFTSVSEIDVTHNLGFPTILTVYVGGAEISVAPTDDGTTASIDFGTPLTGTITYLTTI